MKHNLSNKVSYRQKDDLLVVDNLNGNIVEFKDLSAKLFLKISQGLDDESCLDFLMQNGAKSRLEARRLYNSMIYTLLSLKMISHDRSICINNEKINIATAMIEITNGCNFRCPHCYVDKSKIKTLSLNTFKNIIDELDNLNASSILFTGGEVLTHKDFFKMYRYAYNKGFIISVNTNGSLITDRVVKEFCKYQPQAVEISVYGNNEETYRNFTKCKDQYDNVIKNIIKLKNANINVVCKCVLTNSNSKYFSEIKELCDNIGVNFYSDYLTFPQLNGPFKQNDEQINPEEAINFIKMNPYTQQHYLRAYSTFKMVDQCVFQCKLRDDAIFINSQSRVNICQCMQTISYPYKKGNLLSCILKLKNLAKMQLNSNSKCYKCKLMPLCRYCPAKFYLATGDYQKPPSWYCDFAELVYKNFIAGLRVNKTQYLSDFEKKSLNKLGCKVSLDKNSNQNLTYFVIYYDGKICGYIITDQTMRIVTKKYNNIDEKELNQILKQYSLSI